jgi:hypothetical protein
MGTDTGGTEAPNDLEQCLASYDNGTTGATHDIYCMRKDGHSGPHRDSLRHISWRVVTSAARTREMQSERVD